MMSCTYMYMYIGVLPFKTVFCTFCTQTITNTDYIPLLSFIHYLYIGVLPFKTVFCTFCTQTITNTDYIPLLSFIHYLYIGPSL